MARKKSHPRKLSVLPGDVWLPRIDPLSELTAAEREILVGLVSHTGLVSRGQMLFQHDEIPEYAVVPLSCVLARCKYTGTGKHQIVSFCLPGEICVGDWNDHAALDYAVQTVHPGEAAFVPLRYLKLAARGSDNIRGILRRMALEEAAIGREWLLNLGKREGAACVAHLFCEILWRLNRLPSKFAGLEEPVPLSQEIIAAAAGMSAVHGNRVLKKLQRSRLIAIAGGRVTILDLDQLARFGDFDPSYMARWWPAAPGALR
jgi:CRP-like cAMP-binding protein